MDYTPLLFYVGMSLSGYLCWWGDRRQVAGSTWVGATALAIFFAANNYQTGDATSAYLTLGVVIIHTIFLFGYIARAILSEPKKKPQ